MKVAASLLIDCVATFSCSELCSYTDFVVYTMLSSILHLPRTDLKTKIIDGPEILSIVQEIPIIVSVNHLFLLLLKTLNVIVNLDSNHSSIDLQQIHSHMSTDNSGECTV